MQPPLPNSTAGWGEPPVLAKKMGIKVELLSLIPETTRAVPTAVTHNWNHCVAQQTGANDKKRRVGWPARRCVGRRQDASRSIPVVPRPHQPSEHAWTNSIS